jgi:hypothetical protein
MGALFKFMSFLWSQIMRVKKLLTFIENWASLKQASIPSVGFKKACPAFRNRPLKPKDLSHICHAGTFKLA